jgi:uncharacterized membrane protein YeaQ/YmgE (transglycosylase-associated protein family)
MGELIAYIAPMLVLAGLACGWTTQAALPARGYGLRGDMGLGLAGSFALASVLYGVNRLGGVGLVPAFLIGVTGAVFVIIAQRTLWQNPHLQT